MDGTKWKPGSIFGQSVASNQTSTSPNKKQRQPRIFGSGQQHDQSSNFGSQSNPRQTNQSKFYKRNYFSMFIDPRQQNRRGNFSNPRNLDSSSNARSQNMRVDRSPTQKRGNQRQQHSTDANKGRNESKIQSFFGRNQGSSNPRAGFAPQAETFNNMKFSTWNQDQAHPMKTTNQLMNKVMRASTQSDMQLDESNSNSSVRGSGRGRGGSSRGRGSRGRGYRGRPDQYNRSPTKELDPLNTDMQSSPQGQQWKKNKFKPKPAKDDSNKKRKIVCRFFLEGR